MAATKRQDDWRPEQNGGGWSGGPSTTGGERTSRGHAVQVVGASYSTPSWQVSSSSGPGGVPAQPPSPTKKPDGGAGYMSNNVIDEPNQQGLAQNGAGPNVPAALLHAVPVLLTLTAIAL